MIEGTGSVGSPADGAHVLYEQRIKQLKGELKLAEEGLANYAQENERLRELLAAFEELLALDSENCPGTDLYDVMLQTGSVLRSEPQSGKQA